MKNLFTKKKGQLAEVEAFDPCAYESLTTEQKREMRGGYPPGIDPPQGGGGGGFPTDSIGPYRGAYSFIGPTNIRGGYRIDTIRASRSHRVDSVNTSQSSFWRRFFDFFDYAPCNNDPLVKSFPGDPKLGPYIGKWMDNYRRGEKNTNRCY